MAERTSLATLITRRDSLETAYDAISGSPTSSYTMGDRTFTYAARVDLRKEIDALNREILCRSTTYKAHGKNRVDFEKWN